MSDLIKEKGTVQIIIVPPSDPKLLLPAGGVFKLRPNLLIFEPQVCEHMLTLTQLAELTHSYLRPLYTVILVRTRREFTIVREMW